MKGQKSRHDVLSRHLRLTIFLLVAIAGVSHDRAQAQGSNKDCEQIKKDINSLQEELTDLAGKLGVAQQAFDRAVKGLQKFDSSPAIKKVLQGKVVAGDDPIIGEFLEIKRKLLNQRTKAKNQIEELNLTIQAIKDTITDFLNKLGDCGAKKTEEKPKPKSTPSPISSPTPRPTSTTSTPKGAKPRLGANPSSRTTPATKPRIATGLSGTIDSCLVGTWRSETITNDIVKQEGGAGILLTIKADGTVSIDYNGMTPITGTDLGANWWTGTATGHITTTNGTAKVTSVENSELTHKYTYLQGKTISNPLSGLGPATLSNRNYTCDETTLTYKAVQIFKFKREKKEP